MYHLVFPAKDRRAVIARQVDEELKNTCLEVEKGYEVKFLEIGSDEGSVPFLEQSVPMYRVRKLVTMIKSLTAGEVLKACPQVKKQLWGGEFWSAGYFPSTVGKHGDEAMIAKYVQKQGGVYQKFHENHQLLLF